MIEPVEIYTDRVEHYKNSRPSYPCSLIKTLQQQCALDKHKKIADIGSGTGIFTELLLDTESIVFGIEPNCAMRAVAEKKFSTYTNFKSINATAENIALPDHTFHLITVAQAFHWFDQNTVKKEFIRLLRKDGWVALIWNIRKLTDSHFLTAYEELIKKFSPEYEKSEQYSIFDAAEFLFGRNNCDHAIFVNSQELNFQELKNLLLSYSYTPNISDSGYLSMLASLEKIYNAHAISNKVKIEYDTHFYLGKLHD